MSDMVIRGLADAAYLELVNYIEGKRGNLGEGIRSAALFGIMQKAIALDDTPENELAAYRGWLVKAKNI